ncbi:hypothetical protein ACV349_32200, partial [Pseudomonas aeruginosa]
MTLPAGTGDGPLPFPVEQFGHALAAWLDRVAGSHELPTGEFQVPAGRVIQGEHVDIALRRHVGVGEDRNPPIGEGMGVQI